MHPSISHSKTSRRALMSVQDFLSHIAMLAAAHHDKTGVENEFDTVLAHFIRAFLDAAARN